MPKTTQDTDRTNGRGERQSIQVISRAAAIMRVLERHPDGLSLGEIAKRVELSRSTVQRIVDALDRENLVLASTGVNGVRLGPALLRLASAVRFTLRDVARDTIEGLSRETGETIDLSICDHDKAVFIDQVVGTQRLMAVSAVGGAFPLHCAASGKAMLAAMDDNELSRIRKKITLVRHTKNTITTWAALDRELEHVRRSGVAFDREENSLGICALGVALRGPSGELGAISMPVPAQRFAERERELARALLQAAGELQERLDRRSA